MEIWRQKDEKGGAPMLNRPGRLGCLKELAWPVREPGRPAHLRATLPNCPGQFRTRPGRFSYSPSRLAATELDRTGLAGYSVGVRTNFCVGNRKNTVWTYYLLG